MSSFDAGFVSNSGRRIIDMLIIKLDLVGYEAMHRFIALLWSLKVMNNNPSFYIESDATWQSDCGMEYSKENRVA